MKKLLDLILSPVGFAVLFTLSAGVGGCVMLDLWRGSVQAAGEARLERNLGDARGETAADAVDTLGESHRAETTTDTITRENDDAIRSATGATVPVDPAVAAAGRDGLCRRAVYYCSLQCLQRAPARKLEARCARGGAP